MFDARSYLIELGFDPRAGSPTLTELKKRWHDLCQQHHPDKGGDAEVFRRVTHAYKMITDPEYQHREMLNEMRSGKPNLKGDLNIRIEVKVPFEDVFFGRKMLISFSTDEYDENFVLKVGAIEVSSVNLELTPKILSHSNGVQEFVQIGKGHRQGPHKGDVVVVINTARHNKFRVQGMDVYSEERIPLNLMLKGGKFDVLTMYGIQTAKIKPGHQPGERVRIANCGISRVGCHFVVIQPIFPSVDDLKGTDWRGLEIDWGSPVSEDETSTPNSAD
jgi:DnaJ-class molecular chaperone